MATDNLFVSFFHKVSDLLTYINARVPMAGVTISNYNVQSIGNRSTSFKVVGSMTIGGKVFEVTLRNWRPARDKAGYKGEIVAGIKSNSGATWQKARTANFKDVTLEAVAWMTYFVEQCYTGQLVSAESSFKIAMLDIGLKTLKPTKFVVSIWVSDNQVKPFVYTLPQIKHLILADMPRFEMIKSQPAKTSKRQARVSRNIEY